MQYLQVKRNLYTDVNVRDGRTYRVTYMESYTINT
jgi:hypothetical protein